MNKYVPEEYFSVIYKNTGKKKCDCGWEIDAINIVSRNPEELTYVKNNNHIMGQVIDVTPPPALPTNEIVVSRAMTHEEMLEEAEKREKEQLKLPESELEPLNLS